MSPIRTALIASLFLSLSSVFAADKVTKQLEVNYAAISKAFVSKDLDGMMRFLAPDFFAKDLDGSILTRAKVSKDFKQQMDATSNVTWVRKVTALTHEGKAVVATVEGKFSGVYTMPDQKTSALSFTATAKDRWLFDGKKWVLKSSTVTKRKILLDGKPVGGH